MELWKVVIVVATAAVPTLAAADSDTAQILKLLQGINGRLDSMERRLNAVEGTDSSQASQTKAAPVAVAPQNAVPGWRISIVALTKSGGYADTPIARVSAPIGPTLFNLHFGGGRVTSQVVYQGTAFFWAKSPGKYTFSIGVDQSNAGRYLCYTDMSIEQTELFNMKKSNGDSPFTASGGVELQEGKYAVSYNVACRSFYDSFGKQMVDRQIAEYKQISYDVKVLDPDDDQLREFEPDELFSLK